MILPIVERELRARARQGMTYWSRCGLAALAGLSGAQVLSAATPGPLAPGLIAFRALAWLGLLFACGSVLLSADSISQERREGSLGMLFLAPLRGYEVVLAKFMGVGLLSLYALI